jgi:hypothetical protein
MKIDVTRKQLSALIEQLEVSAAKTQSKINRLASGKDAMTFLFECKFNQCGFNPLNSSIKLNFIEQLNQTFTYLATFKGAEYIFLHHQKVKSLTLNLGTISGTDIESQEDGGVVAEVFASVKPTNNKKLKNDISRIKKVEAKYRYVFFISPKVPHGIYKSGWDVENITVISFGDGLAKELK